MISTCGAFGASIAKIGGFELGFHVLGLDGDRHQRVAVGIVMIEAAIQSLAVGNDQIELELVAAAGGRVGPHGVGDHRAAAVAKVDSVFPMRLDARRIVEELRQLGKRDRIVVVEIARRVARAEQVQRARTCAGGFRQKMLQVDGFAGPGGAH